MARTLVNNAGTLTGTVKEFAGNTGVPAGYLVCDGSAVSRTIYANLWAVIGVAHGQGDGTTTFNLPDLRGRFPRGSDAMFGGAAAGRDPNAGARTAGGTGGNVGAAVGSVQGQATAKNGLGTNNPAVTSGVESANHTHVAYQYQYPVTVQGTGNVAPFISNVGGGGSSTGSQSAQHTHTTTTNVTLTTGDSETRPTNIGLNFIIKY